MRPESETGPAVLTLGMPTRRIRIVTAVLDVVVILFTFWPLLLAPFIADNNWTLGLLWIACMGGAMGYFYLNQVIGVQLAIDRARRDISLLTFKPMQRRTHRVIAFADVDEVGLTDPPPPTPSDEAAPLPAAVMRLTSGEIIPLAPVASQSVSSTLDQRRIDAARELVETVRRQLGRPASPIPKLS